MTIAVLISILLKILGSPALIAGLIAFLQKTLHPEERFYPPAPCVMRVPIFLTRG